MTYLKITLLGLISLAMVGCIGLDGPGPILNLGVKDAQTTLMWVEHQEAANTLSPEDAVIAKQCPNAIIALDTLRESLKPLPDEAEGFRGVIYYGTLSRFKQGPEDLIRDHLTDVVNKCTHLIPSDKIVDALF